MTELKSLQNHLLIAMPSLDDPYFERSLTYICEHNDEGAMGIVLNQPSSMNLKQLLEQTDKELEISADKAEQIVLAGGRSARSAVLYCILIRGNGAPA